MTLTTNLVLTHGIHEKCSSCDTNYNPHANEKCGVCVLNDWLETQPCGVPCLIPVPNESEHGDMECITYLAGVNHLPTWRFVRKFLGTLWQDPNSVCLLLSIPKQDQRLVALHPNKTRVYIDHWTYGEGQVVLEQDGLEQELYLTTDAVVDLVHLDLQPDCIRTGALFVVGQTEQDVKELARRRKMVRELTASARQEVFGLCPTCMGERSVRLPPIMRGMPCPRCTKEEDYVPG